MDPWDKVLSGANMEPLCFAFLPVKSDDSVGTHRYVWDDGERMGILPPHYILVCTICRTIYVKVNIKPFLCYDTSVITTRIDRSWSLMNSLTCIIHWNRIVNRGYPGLSSKSCDPFFKENWYELETCAHEFRTTEVTVIIMDAVGVDTMNLRYHRTACLCFGDMHDSYSRSVLTQSHFRIAAHDFMRVCMCGIQYDSYSLFAALTASYLVIVIHWLCMCVSV